MKRKKNGPVPEPVPAPAPLVEAAFSWKDAVQVCLFGVLLFLAMTVQTGRMSVVLPVAALALTVGRGPIRRFQERLCLPTAAFLAFALVYGLAAVYAKFGDYAVNEFYKFMASIAVAAIFFARFDRRHVRGLMWVIAAVCAVISLLCTDEASWGVLFEAFNNFVKQLGGSFDNLHETIENTRVGGIYNDANVSGSLVGLGALLGLHLTLTAGSRQERFLACLLMGMNGMGFFLAFSRGGILCFGLALAVYLAAVGKELRLRLFLLMVYTTVITIVLSIPAIRALPLNNFLPDVLTLTCGLPVFALYELTRDRVSHLVERNRRAAAYIVGGFAALVLVYVVAAFCVTGPYTLDGRSLLIRAAHVPEGTYTVSADHDGDISVNVSYVPPESASVRIYSGDLDSAVLEVPESGGYLLLALNGEAGTEIRSLTLSDGTRVRLNYPLLPDFVINRLQGNFFQDSSFTLRVQFIVDGWKLFLQRPLLGAGLGSTEGLLTSVQPFFYESLFVHNHVIQILDDCGLLGGVFFLLFLGGSLWLLVRRLRESADPAAAVLVACWVLMNVHGLIEINFSIRAYQCVAWLLLLLPAVLYGRPFHVLSEKAVRWCGALAAVFLWVYLAVFAGLLELHRVVGREMESFSTNSAAEFMETTKRWVRMDVFDHEQNQLNFVGNAVLLNDNRYNREMRLYTEELRASGTYTACTGLAQYYYLPLGEYEELFAVSREAVAQEASVSDAWNQQFDFYRLDVLPAVGTEHMDVFLDGVLALGDFLEAYSEGRKEEIALTEENQLFLSQVRQCRASGLDGESAMLYLMVMGSVRVET